MKAQNFEIWQEEMRRMYASLNGKSNLFRYESNNEDLNPYSGSEEQPLRQFELYADTECTKRPVVGESYSVLYLLVNADINNDRCVVLGGNGKQGLYVTYNGPAADNFNYAEGDPIEFLFFLNLKASDNYNYLWINFSEVSSSNDIFEHGNVVVLESWGGDLEFEEGVGMSFGPIVQECHLFEMWADEECTVRPQEGQSYEKLYIQVNKEITEPYGLFAGPGLSVVAPDELDQQPEWAISYYLNDWHGTYNVSSVDDPLPTGVYTIINNGPETNKTINIEDISLGPIVQKIISVQEESIYPHKFEIWSNEECTERPVAGQQYSSIYLQVNDNITESFTSDFIDLNCIYKLKLLKTSDSWYININSKDSSDFHSYGAEDVMTSGDLLPGVYQLEVIPKSGEEWGITEKMTSYWNYSIGDITIHQFEIWADLNCTLRKKEFKAGDFIYVKVNSKYILSGTLSTTVDQYNHLNYLRYSSNTETSLVFEKISDHVIKPKIVISNNSVTNHDIFVYSDLTDGSQSLLEPDFNGNYYGVFLPVNSYTYGNVLRFLCVEDTILSTLHFGKDKKYNLKYEYEFYNGNTTGEFSGTVNNVWSIRINVNKDIVALYESGDIYPYYFASLPGLYLNQYGVPCDYYHFAIKTAGKFTNYEDFSECYIVLIPNGSNKTTYFASDEINISNTGTESNKKFVFPKGSYRVQTVLFNNGNFAHFPNIYRENLTNCIPYAGNIIECITYMDNLIN